MGYHRRSSFFDSFTLNPLPYPVLLILAVTFIFLGISWFFSYEEAIESAEEQMGWILFATPIVLIVLVRWLSSFETDMFFSSKSPINLPSMKAETGKIMSVHVNQVQILGNL
ncbi:hypothetical protein LWI28_022918 [Acer negundo]|uniref:Uncharacterized protein n=1 Tax=Acer negundo TaxID=4023 RepID=A0AAD5NVF6_ACENE|nr:hypothetical protein LWI28_022918 [Acer negundo]KAK4836061.1 hypothetical protein QYF36_018033 [Acer negundo]